MRREWRIGDALMGLICYVLISLAMLIVGGMDE